MFAKLNLYVFLVLMHCTKISIMANNFCLAGRSTWARGRKMEAVREMGKSNPFSVPTEPRDGRAESLRSAKQRHPFKKSGQSDKAKAI